MQPGIAVVANSIAPYRVYLHTQLAARIPELQLHTLITHGAAEFDWKIDVPDSINATFFGTPGDSPLASSLNPFAFASEWRKGGRIIDYLSEHNIRAVILNGYRYLSYLRVIQFCSKAGIPLFGRNDSNIRCERHLPKWKRWLKARIFGWWIPRTRGVMSMGELGDEFFQQYGADPSRIYRVPYLPDLEFFGHVDPRDLERLRQEYGLNANRHYLLYSGRLVPVKRVDLLIDAFVAIADARPEWDLLVVGDGVCGNELHQRVPEHLRHRVIWTGFQETAGCVAAYHSADILVLPSDREPWAVVIQEALAAGLPIISSDVVGAAQELVKDQFNGRVFQAGDLSALNQAVLETTSEATLAQYRGNCQAVLSDWLHRADPVMGVRRALEDVGVL